MQHWTIRLVQVLGLLLCLQICYSRSQAACYCARSNSTYLLVPGEVTTRPPGAATTDVTAAGATASSSLTGTAQATTGIPHGASTTPPRGPECTATNNATLLSSVFGSNAFSASSTGYTFNASNNQFTVPKTVEDDKIVMDLQVGSTGTICRQMPYIEQICVSSQCDGCNLNLFTAAAAKTLSDPFTQRIFYPTSVVSTTVCACRDVLQDFGDFRYIVFLPQDSTAPSSPYAFKVSINGNFSSYSCSSRRRRSLLDDAPVDSAGVGSVDANVNSFFRLLSRSRRAVPDDCSCPVGQDPVFASVRTVLVSWEFPLKLFNGSLGDTSTAEYLALARESYYLMMDAVRNASVSNLTSVVADLFDIVFSSGNNGTRLTAKLTVRNDSFFSDSFLQLELRAIIPGYGSSVVNLLVGSSQAPGNSAPPPGLPGFAIALICILCIAAVAAVVTLVLWRLHVFGEHRNLKVLQYQVPQAAEPVSSASAREFGELKLGASLDGDVQMPATAIRGFSVWASSTGQQQEPVDYENVQNGNPVAEFWATAGNSHVQERAV